MDAVYVGALSLMPPVIAIVLALLTKEVLLSLLAGIVSGSIIYSVAAGMNPIIGAANVTFELIVTKCDMYIIVFCFLLGALVYLVKASGGAEAYGRWASKYIKSRTLSMLLTGLLGCIIFVDDYFNALTVGTVMKPVTDRYNVSRAKLAFIIDATSAPVCIIAPISSWAAAVASYLKGTGAFESDLMAFCAAIPYNFYALLCLLMVFLVCVFSIDFGPMQKEEYNALHHNDVGAEDDDVVASEGNTKGSVADMLVPIGTLIVFGILAMMYIGGFWGDDPEIAGHFGAALGNSVAAQALVWGNFAALIVAFIMYVPRKIMGFHEFLDNCVTGMKSMMTSACILFLAWAIGGVCRDLLSTPEFVSNLFETLGVPGMLIPAIVFIFAAFLSFATGTSWGTFGILIPIVVPVAQAIAPSLIMASLAATLAGSIFGDHCSPISDTTILSSTGAGCNHLKHVGTQMPYSITIAVSSFIGYIILGFTDSLALGLGSAVVLMVAIMYVLHKKGAADAAKAAK